jgi:hypothetical protein
MRRSEKLVDTLIVRSYAQVFRVAGTMPWVTRILAPAKEARVRFTESMFNAMAALTAPQRTLFGYSLWWAQPIIAAVRQR